MKKIISTVELNITILTDKKSYMNDYNFILSDKLKQLGHDVRLINSKDELTNGDIAFFFSVFELVSEDKLKLNRNNIIIHESDLPAGKGWSPASWQIIEGVDRIVLTAFEAISTVDSGDIYFKEAILLDGTELAEQWRRKIALKKIEMCLRLVENYPQLKPVPQQGKESFYRKRTMYDSKLNPNKTIAEQFNLLRIVDNDLYPAFFFHNGKKYLLKIYTDDNEPTVCID